VESPLTYKASTGLPARGHQAGTLQNLEVFRDGGHAHLQRASASLVTRIRPRPDGPESRDGWVGEAAERGWLS